MCEESLATKPILILTRKEISIQTQVPLGDIRTVTAHLMGMWEHARYLTLYTHTYKLDDEQVTTLCLKKTVWWSSLLEEKIIKSQNLPQTNI